MHIDSDRGLLMGARYVPSPNCDTRPAASAIDALIIHAISLPPGEFGGTDIERFFCNQLDCARHDFYREIQNLKVSSHLLIRRDGEVVQFVPFHLRAWHAGESVCEGRARVNDFSIGIELEGTDEAAFTAAQYRALADVTKLLMRQYPGITLGRVYGHVDVAPGRKTDPGPRFDWPRYVALCRARGAGPESV